MPKWWEQQQYGSWRSPIWRGARRGNKSKSPAPKRRAGKSPRRNKSPRGDPASSSTGNVGGTDQLAAIRDLVSWARAEGLQPPPLLVQQLGAARGTAADRHREVQKALGIARKATTRLGRLQQQLDTVKLKWAARQEELRLQLLREAKDVATQITQLNKDLEEAAQAETVAQRQLRDTVPNRPKKAEKLDRSFS